MLIQLQKYSREKLTTDTLFPFIVQRQRKKSIVYYQFTKEEK